MATLRIGHEYVDKATDKEIDEFLSFFSTPPRRGHSEAARGISNAGGIRGLLTRRGDLAALILVSHEVRGTHHNPWEDFVDLRTGSITYWGDAKYHRTKRRDDFPGNKRLVGIMDRVAHRRWDLVPPILHFSKPRRGIVRFNGVCCLKRLDEGWIEDRTYPVRNYIAHLEIVAIDEIDSKWVSSLVNQVAPDQEPEVWSRYRLSGSVKRLNVYSQQTLTTEQQLPEEGTADHAVLDQLRSLDPHAFEALIVSVFQEMASRAAASHTIRPTPKSGDGGFDFEGEMRLLPPLHYRIPLKGEVKRYAPSSGVGPKDMARLVARLQRGEFGIFVTTSYFTRACQQEVIHDLFELPQSFLPKTIDRQKVS